MKTLKEIFSMRKVDYIFFLKNYVKGDHCTLLYAWGAMIIDHRMMHQKWTMTSLQAACAWGVMILKQEKT
jgi:hypothetical protein